LLRKRKKRIVLRVAPAPILAAEQHRFGEAFLSRTLLVVDRPDDWAPYYPSEQVITFNDYLALREQSEERTRIINLCRNYKYLSDGYYCSLLAEARGHHAIPSVRTLNDLGRRDLFELQFEGLSAALDKAVRDRHPEDTSLTLYSFFGTVTEPACRDLARALFERFPCPVLEISLKRKKHWKIAGLRAVSHRGLSEEQESRFAGALDEFSRKVWRSSKRRRQWRYDMAILVNAEEKLPPSNAGALRRFIRAGRKLGIDVELIARRDYVRLAEFDALFIRETTAIDHYTYRFATRADREGLVVVDDPVSILRCTNKIFLADLFRTRSVPAPRTWLLHKGDREKLSKLESEASYPLVIKIPDGSFSRGVSKVADRAELERTLKKLFERSSLLLAQEYIYTEFDWRIGVFNHQPLYACRYYMVRNHWQIYRHGQKGTASGGFDTLPVSQAPAAVVDAALAATAGIGDGLYGVDVKEREGQGYVIEVNDNPNIDAGIEDASLGESLYTGIMEEFLRRLELRHQLSAGL
jgi:glutathione synthase/RimK-type ligase-like ATP-grasp enzyme